MELSSFAPTIVKYPIHSKIQFIFQKDVKSNIQFIMLFHYVGAVTTLSGIWDFQRQISKTTCLIGGLSLNTNIIHFGYLQGIGPILNVSVLVYADLDHLNEWCRSNKFDLNAGECKSISFCSVYSIDGTALVRVDKIKDLGKIMDCRMTFLSHIEAIISNKSSRILGLMEFHDSLHS
jgi:hypothetical protein